MTTGSSKILPQGFGTLLEGMNHSHSKISREWFLGVEQSVTGESQSLLFCTVKSAEVWHEEWLNNLCAAGYVWKGINQGYAEQLQNCK